jgi:hypothetical protein
MLLFILDSFPHFDPSAVSGCQFAKFVFIASFSYFLLFDIHNPLVPPDVRYSRHTVCCSKCHVSGINNGPLVALCCGFLGIISMGI